MIKIFRFDNDNKEFSSNTYVIGEKNKPCVVIDLGSTSDRVINYIKDNHTSCLGVLLTHGHFDHIRGLEKFLKEFHCTVFVHENDEKFFSEPRYNGSLMIDGSPKTVNVSSNNIYLLDDEDEINFGGGLLFFKVIATPFHTTGSVCYLCEKENALFTGDTLFRGSIGRTDLPDGKTRLIESSLSKIKKLNPELKIYPGHGDVSTLHDELEENIYLNGGN